MGNSKDRRRAAAVAADKRRAPKKKVSILAQERITYIDYKDVNLLRRFMSERAKIRARRVTGNDVKQQREVARAIRVAREMALLPYAVRQTTSRGKGRGRDRRERDDDNSTLEATIELETAPTVVAGYEDYESPETVDVVEVEEAGA